MNTETKVFRFFSSSDVYLFSVVATENNATYVQTVGQEFFDTPGERMNMLTEKAKKNDALPTAADDWAALAAQNIGQGVKSELAYDYITVVPLDHALLDEQTYVNESVPTPRRKP